MNCPNCGTEMEAGFLYFGRGPALIWTKNKRKITFATTSKDVLVCEGGMGNPWPAACVCKDCRKVILEY